jgi:hypothetical protein
MRKLLLFVALFFAFMIAYNCASAQWCEKDPDHPLCICEKQPTHPNCCCTPVELEGFTVTTEGERAMLRWKTASEQNNDYFIVSRSEDAEAWEMIAIVDGNGTTTEPKRYSFIDINPKTSKTYYRLSQIDFNGTEKHLSIQFALFDWNVVEGFKVYGDIVSYQYFNSNGGIAGNHSGLNILRVVTTQSVYNFKILR